MKRKTLLGIFCLFVSVFLFAQCPTLPPIPACDASGVQLTANEIVGPAQTRYYSGSSGYLSYVKLRGGTIIVCGSLTLNELTIDSGQVIVLPFASLTVSNASGLILRGNATIVNWGVFQSLGNLVMDHGGDAAHPSIAINAHRNSVWKMANQYFVINNPYGFFLNNGTADFHGIITDPAAAKNSICLGQNSQINMIVLYNKARHTYTVNGSNACVRVHQYSQLTDTLTATPALQVCLGSGHSSDNCGSCRPNAWGMAQVTPGCSSCMTLLNVLASRFLSISATAQPNHNRIDWKTAGAETAGTFHLERSSDGTSFTAVDSIFQTGETAYSLSDRSPKSGVTYYRIRARNSGGISYSAVASVQRATPVAEVYPNPFLQSFTVMTGRVTGELLVEVRDVYGREVRDVQVSAGEYGLQVRLSGAASGTYFVRVKTAKQWKIYKVQKL